MNRRRQHRIVFKAGFVIVASVIAAFALEGVHRAWLWIGGHPYRSAEIIVQMHEIADGAAGALRLPGDGQPQDDLVAQASKVIVLHPYFGYDTRVSVKRVAREFEGHVSAEDRYDIMILGGSVASIFGDLGSDRLRALLNEDPRFAGREIYFLRFARTTFKQPQQQNVLAYMLSLGFRPDLVLNIDGFNEVTLTAHNTATEVHASYPLGDFWKSMASLGPNGMQGILAYAALLRTRADLTAAAKHAQSSYLTLSSVFGTWSLARLRRQQQDLADRTQEYLRSLGGRDANVSLYGPESARTVKEAVELGVEMWAEGSLSMHAMCRERGIAYLHVLQPTLHDAGSKPMTVHERENAGLGGLLLAGARLGYPMLRKMGKVLRNRGVVFLDATKVFVDIAETLYLDACHFNERGNLILAETIGPIALQLLPDKLTGRSPSLLRGELRDGR